MAATTSDASRQPMMAAYQSPYYYPSPFFSPFAGWSGAYVPQPSHYRNTFFSGAPPNFSDCTDLVLHGDPSLTERPASPTSSALVRVKVPPTQRDTPAEYPCPPTEDPDNPPVPIHPYLYEESGAVVWDVRTNFRNNARRAHGDGGILSSIALKANAVNAGGMNQSSIRILIEGMPWSITVKRESGVTVADVFMDIATELDKEMTESERWIASPERVAEAEEHRKANEGSGTRKIREAGDKMRRVDWLGKRTKYRGLVHSSHPDHGLLVKRKCHGHEKANTWILILDERED